MDDTTLDALEYPVVLKELASRAVTAMGMERLIGLTPMTDAALIGAAFAFFAELDELSKTSGTLPLAGTVDIRPLIARLGPEGAYLLPEELHIVRTNIQAATRLKTVLNPVMRQRCPITVASLDALSENTRLAGELNRVLSEGDKGGIKDTASPTLHRIRKEIRGNKERARAALEEVSSSGKYREFLQDDFITIRDDRYCLAIRAEKHSFVDGVIHGRSASGATYFVEPIALVELNNRLAILKRDEKNEEIEILKAVTLEVETSAPGLLSDLDIIGTLDAVQAKVDFSIALKARVPLVKTSGAVRLQGARHPLLVLKALRPGLDVDPASIFPVVPVDINIPVGCKTLIISGANTGGKTVALKTAGLLTLMTLSGIPIPVDEGSEAIIFSAIFSDIGDRQDIIASLSTFSAHVKRLKEFLTVAGPGSLVLIDEIGSGTDPSEGGAFALAAIEHLMSQGAVTVVTTHLNLIKAHAQSHAEFLNASVEFDESTMHPLYRLCYGVPGPSLGLSIAEGLGISKEIIASARAKVMDREGAFIESVRLIEKEREELRAIKVRLERQAELRDKAITRLRSEREEIRRKARERVEGVVAKARAEMRAAIDKVKLEAGRGAAQASVRAVEKIGARALEAVAPVSVTGGYRPAVNERVVIAGSKTRGTVLRVDEAGKKAEISVGKLKVWTPFDKLEKKGEEAQAKTKTVAVKTAVLSVEAAATLKLIGMRVEPALDELQKFIDNAHASGLHTVEVIHGLGTGALAKAVAEYLRSSSIVESFHHGDPDRGGAGVTVVVMR